MSSKETPSWGNAAAEVMKVRHQDLERYSDDSPYRSQCPVCPNGVLLVGRDLETLRLLEHDFCISCGQKVLYLDIEELREQDGWLKS